MPNEPRTRVQLNSADGILAVVPHLLGFHPANSLVVLGMAGPKQRVRLAFRYDLPQPGDQLTSKDIADHAVFVLRRESISSALVIGYGPGNQVSPVMDVVRCKFNSNGIVVEDALRVDDGRYWSYTCSGLACCPAEGRQIEGETHPAALALAVAGLPAVKSREERAASIAPIADDIILSDAVYNAVALLEKSEQVIYTQPSKLTFKLVSDAVACYRSGNTLDTTNLVKLVVVVQGIATRDFAWAHITPEHSESSIKLWTDVVRRAPELFVAAPASLLAFAAWQGGDGALGSMAVNRALEDDPNYSMAHLIYTALTAGLSPAVAKLSLTPNYITAKYLGQD